jgi:hypothetical protein
MNSVEQLPPTRWAAFAGLGSLLMVSPALFALLKLPDFSTHDVGSGTGWPVRLILLGVPVLVGLGMAVMAVKRLRDGIKTNVWSEAELEVLRRRVRNPTWGALSVALVLLGFGLAVADHGSGHGALFCFLIAPSQVLLQLVSTTRPAANTQDRVDLNGSTAMRSER